MSDQCNQCKGQAYLILPKMKGDEKATRFRFCDCGEGQRMQELFMQHKVGIRLSDDQEVWFDQLRLPLKPSRPPYLPMQKVGGYFKKKND